MARLVAVAAAWLLANLAWLHTDSLLRDGDEEGHVGAAELLMGVLHSDGLLAFLRDALAGSYGEYPPLYPALVAAWWSLTGGGLPSRTAVRAIGLLWPLLSAGAVASIAPRARRLLPFTLTLLAPGLCGISRHFMPEGALVAAVSLTAAAAWRAHQRPTWARAALLGGAAGLALLTKQTAILYLLGPAAFALWGLRHRALLSAAVTAAIAAPWYVSQLDAQREYLSHSADVAASGLSGLAYYPIVGAWSAWGPVLTVLLLAGLAGHRQAAVRLGVAWGAAGLLLLTATPRKYPRLLAPLLPAAALIAGVGVGRPRWGWVGAAGAAGWLGAASTVWTLPEPPLVTSVDDGCLQRWLRPPEPDDFGLSVVAAAVRDRGARRVSVLDGPQIPCHVQTTHPWTSHLDPYLRRAGSDVEVTTSPGGDLTVAWGEAGVTVAPLGSGFSLR